MKKNKILIVGKKNHLGWIEHTLDAAKQIDNIKSDNFFINYLNIDDKIKKLYYKLTSNNQKIDILIAQAFEKKIKSFKPDLILFISGFFIPLELYKIAKLYDIDTAAWIGDKFGNEKENYADYIDMLYVADSGFVEIAKKLKFKNIKILQFGYNNLIHKNFNLKRDDYVNFVGSYTKERNDIFMALKDYKLQIEGFKWNKLDSISRLWRIKVGKISQKQVVDIYNKTIATLNIAQYNNIINIVNMRTFEAMACGSCVISDNVKDLSYCFEPNKEILVYNDIEELKNIFEIIRTDQDFIRKIAKNGYNKITKNHMTYKDKLEDILKDFK